MARQFAAARKTKRWSSINSISLALTASGTSLGASLNPGQAVTFMRMLGEYLITPTPGGTFVAGDGVIISLGIGIVSADAFAAGAGSVPDPAGEPNYPWMYWADHQFVFAGASPGGDEVTVNLRRRFDIGAMRKIKPQQTLAYVVEYTDISGAPPMTVALAKTRVLIAET